MPKGLTREHVYLVWLAITSLGVGGLLLARRGLRALGGVVLMLAALLQTRMDRDAIDR
jgi:hypothetical protein